MATGLFNVALTGLNAAQYGLQTTSHNISNVSTPGYNRQQIVQSTNTPMFTGSGFIGQGTNVDTIKRNYSEYLSNQLLSAQTSAAEMDSYQAEISQIDNLLADKNAGLSPALSDYFKGVQAVAANPSDISSRQSMISASQELVSRFQSLNQRLQEIRDGVNSQISGEVSAINSYAQQIAELNQRIIDAQANGTNQPPNDLLDQRDQLVASLNKEIRVSTLTQSDGTYSVFIGNGEPLVVGILSYSLQAVTASENPEKITVALQSPSGGTVTIPESQLTGGTLGGLVSFRYQTLDDVQNSLGRIALTLAQNVNDQNQLGQDLTGQLGIALFDLSNAGPTVYPNVNNTPGGGPPPTIGTPAVTISNVTNLTTSDYQLTFAGGQYTLTRLSDQQVWSAGTLGGLPWPIDGLTVTAGTWTPAANDSFLILPTRVAAGNLALNTTDPKAIAAAAPVRTAATLTNTGTASIDAGSVTSTVNLPLAGTVTLTYNSLTSQFVVTGPIVAGPFAYTSGQPISFGGLTVTISGAPANGDTFTIVNNGGGVSDNRNATLLGALQTKNTIGGTTTTAPTASYQTAYAQIVSSVGNTARQVQVTAQAQQSLVDQAQTARDQLSGVNLDEEAANLLRYQQAYQASAKIFDIAGKLFDQILALRN